MKNKSIGKVLIVAFAVIGLSGSVAVAALTSEVTPGLTGLTVDAELAQTPSWSPLGSGVNDYVYGIAVDGNGNVYAGGKFTMAGGVSANRIAKWNGSSWETLGTGMDGTVQAVAVDGSGNVYAGGDFTGHAAKWNGSSWAILGTGLDASVTAIAVDGSGNVYAGGEFTKDGGSNASYIAKWNGSSWEPLGSDWEGVCPSSLFGSPVKSIGCVQNELKI